MTRCKELTSYKDYGRVLEISNGVVEAYVTLDLGPRVIRFGYVGGQNIMNANRNEFDPLGDEEFQNFFGEGKKWENLGGHRIWTSPEAYPDTYYPDCDPVKYEITENGAIFTPPAETENGVQKQMEIKMDPDDTNMQLTMRVTNITNAAKEFAIWGLTVSEKGGTVIIPMNDNDTRLLHNRSISVWPYTDLTDDRIFFGKKYSTIRQDTTASSPLKLGFDINKGTVYYCLGEDIFCKCYQTLHPTAKYPDNNCSFESYTNEYFIEVESLGELKSVAPGETSVLTELWSLNKKPCEVDFKDDASIENMLSKI